VYKSSDLDQMGVVRGAVRETLLNAGGGVDKDSSTECKWNLGLEKRETEGPETGPPLGV